MERAQTSLHCTVLPSHNDERVDKLLADLSEAVKTVKVSYCTYSKMAVTALHVRHVACI